MRIVLGWSAATLALVAAAAGREAAPVFPAAAAEAPRCCYANARYAGVCAVQAGESETCASILAYLNNPQSQGKAYCGNTSIRGGWKQVRCTTENRAASTRR